MEEKDYMVDKHGIVVECAYDNLEKKLDSYVSTVDTEKKMAFMAEAFNSFLADIKKKK